VSTTLLVMALIMTAAPDGPPVTECGASDVDCLRRDYERLTTQAPPPCKGARCTEEPLEAATSEKVAGLPWYAVAPAQWATTVATDCLPAGVLVLAAVFGVAGIVLPGSTIPTLLVAGAGCALIPCLPCVQGVATNAVGDWMSRGTQRGRLSLQLLTSMGLLGVQLVTAGIGLFITAAIVNNLLVAFVVPELRLLPARCTGANAEVGVCAEQVGAVSASTSAIAGAAALGVLGIVAANLLVAALIKGPVLALSYALHATEPSGPAFLPRMVERSEPVTDNVKIASAAP